MKTPFILTVIILIAATVIGWRDHQRLEAVRVIHAQTVKEAATRGISPDSANDASTIRVTKRAREDRDAAAKLLAGDYISFAKEKDALRKNGKESDTDFQQREVELHDRMKSLDASQWKFLIQEVCSRTELRNGTRQAFLYNSISMFAHSHPEAALAFLAEAPDIFSGRGKTEHLISTALIGWSKNDPMAALEWIRKNDAAHPKLITENTKREMVTTAAIRDPRIAFKLVKALDIEAEGAVIGDLMSSAATPEQRSASLEGLRAYLETIENEEARNIAGTAAVLSLAHRVCGEGFDVASQWLASAELSPEELRRFSVALPNFIKKEETAQWIGWSAKTYPAAQADPIIRRLVGAWTTADYEAAGKWLASAPEGPVKNAAIQSYSETVFKHDPETAMKWIMTLPPGRDRDFTLKGIHMNWPKDDPTGKEAFAKEHGIK